MNNVKVITNGLFREEDIFLAKDLAIVVGKARRTGYTNTHMYLQYLVATGNMDVL